MHLFEFNKDARRTLLNPVGEPVKGRATFGSPTKSVMPAGPGSMICRKRRRRPACSKSPDRLPESD